MIGNYAWPEREECKEKFVCFNCKEEVFCFPRYQPPPFCRLCFYRRLREDGIHVWNLPEDFETEEAFEEYKEYLHTRKY